MQELSDCPIEEHPLQPFLPSNAKLLMLGSFPPQRKRWSMDFYYPNLQNDMWRIVGTVFFHDPVHFINPSSRCFEKDKIVAFAEQIGIALYDTATSVQRLQNNASDKYLEVVRPTDISLLLEKIPLCRAIATTGQKATDILRAQFGIDEPKIGESVPFTYQERSMRFYRMPSSSRAYPLSIEKKAVYYRGLFKEVGLLE